MLSIFTEAAVEYHWRRVAGLYDVKSLGCERTASKPGETKRMDTNCFSSWCCV